jgi:hypothetical protein
MNWSIIYNIFAFIACIILLFWGRKLFWLFVASMGFLLGFYYAPLFFPTQSLFLIWVISMIAGILGAILAVFAKDAAIIISGFVAGLYITYTILFLIHFPHSQLNWILLILGGGVTAWLLFNIFDYVLIFLSAFVGAYTLVKIFNIFPQFSLIIFFIFFCVGIVFQMKVYLSKKLS